MAVDSEQAKEVTLATLPDDEVRRIMWRFADRKDLQKVVQSARSVARGIVARLVAEGERNTYDWTEKKDEMLPAFDRAGITALSIGPDTSCGKNAMNRAKSRTRRVGFITRR